MRTPTKSFGSLAIFVLMLTGAIANAQTAGKKSDSPSPTTSTSTANQNARGKLQSAHSNPLYEDKGLAGTNPLSQRTVATPREASSGMASGLSVKTSPPSTNSHDVVEYKDPEDMTTRYRPGNNKTTRISNTGDSSSSSSKPAGYKDGEDGVTHTRPSKPK